jgi:hypothetical protein
MLGKFMGRSSKGASKRFRSVFFIYDGFDVEAHQMKIKISFSFEQS